MENSEMEDLEVFGLSYTVWELLPWLYRLRFSIQTVLLFKSADKKGIPPKGMLILISWPVPGRWHAGELERCWRREHMADNLARMSGQVVSHLGYRSMD